MEGGLSLDYLRGIGFAVAAGSGARGTEVKTETEPSLAVGVAKGSSPTLRVLTFNVLFPNSETSGVWWISCSSSLVCLLLLFLILGIRSPSFSSSSSSVDLQVLRCR
ncbi:unnamed protein product [Prorocentrum cordatum]|uniref:Uncharacterized protein n=1 Tax=Prorocentrum cordatum TaxID=2364126 RepID=A0ABN9TYX7_9DINO|nr:unnamed protein product [Polarella glacialis]